MTNNTSAKTAQKRFCCYVSQTRRPVFEPLARDIIYDVLIGWLCWVDWHYECSSTPSAQYFWCNLLPASLALHISHETGLGGNNSLIAWAFRILLRFATNPCYDSILSNIRYIYMRIPVYLSLYLSIYISIYYILCVLFACLFLLFFPLLDSIWIQQVL